jgi:uncharacterized protein DUF6988
MRPETIQHLENVEGIMRQAKLILARHGYPDDSRTVIVIGTITQIIEHHEAMLLLIRNDKVGSAFALARGIVEGVYRGMWINFCATAAQIQEFERDDRLPVNMTEMAQEIDAKYQAQGFFEHLRAKTWAALCSYAHTGMLQLGRRFTGANAQPAYTDEEIIEVTTTSTTCILLLVGKFLAVQNHVAESKEADALLLTYGPAARQKPAPGNLEA